VNESNAGAQSLQTGSQLIAVHLGRAQIGQQ
jgi:hypothetical protein